MENQAKSCTDIIDCSHDGDNLTAAEADNIDSGNEMSDLVYDAKPLACYSNAASHIFNTTDDDANIAKSEEASEEAAGSLNNIGGGDSNIEAVGSLNNMGGGDAMPGAAALAENGVGDGASKRPSVVVENEGRSRVVSREPAWLLQAKDLIKEALLLNSRIIKEALTLPAVKSFLSNLRCAPTPNECSFEDDLRECFGSIEQFMTTLDVAGNPTLLKASFKNLSFLVYGEQRFPDPIPGDGDLALCIDLLWKLADREFEIENTEPLYFGDPTLVPRASELLFYFERQVRILQFLLVYNKMKSSECVPIAGYMDYDKIISNRVTVMKEFFYKALDIEDGKQ